MSAGFLAGVVAGYGIAVPVGAIGVLIAGLSARTSLRAGAAAGLGAATADGIYALIAVAGGAAVAAAIAPVAEPLRWAGGVVLLGLAAWTVRGALRDRRRSPVPRSPSGESRLARAVRGEDVTAGRAFLGVLGLTLLNPATVVYFAALVLGSGDAGGFGGSGDAGELSGSGGAGGLDGSGGAGDPGGIAIGSGGGAWFVAGAFLASASWQLLLAGGGSLIGRVLTGERGRLITALTSSAVIAALALKLLIAG
jgi:threonine/homoserine/homoserine lactone efflux protein